jgi:hypothetical protein
MSDFHKSLIKGKAVEYEVAKLCARFGFSVVSTGSFGNADGVPKGLTDDETIIAPDLLVSRPNASMSISPVMAIEAKCKDLVRGNIWIDEERMNYAKRWSDKFGQPFLFVFKRPPYDEINAELLICASVERLYGNYDAYNTLSTKRDRKTPEPTFIYDPHHFVPFIDFLQHGRQQMSFSFFVRQPDGSEVRI